MKTLALASGDTSDVATTSQSDTDARVRNMFDRNYKFIWRVVSGLGVAQEAVDDVTQEAFVIASRKITDIKQGSERPFLFGTALRLVSQSRRDHAKRWLRRDVEKNVDNMPTEAASPEQTLSRKQDRQMLHQVLIKISIELRAVFVLFELEGLSTVQIAECMAIPIGTVASRLRRGREAFSAEAQRLRARLAGDEVSYG